MSKRLVSVLAAMTVCAPAIPVYAQTAAASIDNFTKTQLQTTGEVLSDVSGIVANTINNIEVEQPEEVSYTYYEQPVYTPVVYYEATSITQEPVVEVVSAPSNDDSYQIAQAAYDQALEAYNAASEIIETTKEVEVEVSEEVTDEDGNVSTVTHTEIQTVTETSYAGDVEAAKAALDAALAALEAAQANPQQTETVEETIVVEEEAVLETALQAVAENQCGENVTWTLSDMGVLNISGSGAMYDYTKDTHSPWYDHRLMVNEVIVNTGVTRIGNYSFDECKSISSVTLADTVTEIGQYAFTHEPGIVESSLTSIVIPDSVTKIEMYAFNYCDNLTTVEFGSGLTTIEKYAFNWCKNLKNVHFVDGLTTIGVQAFYRCQSLETVELPSTLQTVGEGAFKECTSLKNVILNDGLKSINTSAFSGCTSLESIEIPSSVTSLGTNLFSKCTSLMNINVDASNSKYSSVDGIVYNKSKTTLVQCPIGKTAVTIPNTVTKIGNNAFYQCEKLTSISLPELITSLGTSAFYQCNGLVNVVLPDSVTKIGDSIFSMCRNLETVDLGNALTAIPSMAFYSCDKLKSIILPNTLTSIADNAFNSCTALTDVYYRGTEYDWISKNLYDFGSKVTVTCTEKIMKQANAALDLAGNVKVNYMLLFSDDVYEDQGAQLVFKVPFRNEDIVMNIAEAPKDDLGYSVFSVEITSKEIAEVIEASILTSNGYTKQLLKFGAINYCEDRIKNGGENIRNLCIALLNYGAAAQKYFDYDTDNLANKNLTEEQKNLSSVTLDTLTDYKLQIEGSRPSGIKRVDATLDLKSTTTVNYIYTLENGASISDYTFRVDGQEVEPIKESANVYAINKEGIVSKKLDDLYTVVVQKKGDTNTFGIKFGPLSYAHLQLSITSSSANIQNLCRALYLYNQAANVYFND